MDNRTIDMAFPNIRLGKELETAFLDINIEKAVWTPDKSELRVCLTSPHLIERRHIVKLERLLENSLNRENARTFRVRILQKYMLSGSYNLKSLMDIYGPSIRDELKDVDHLMASAFRNSGIECSESGEMNITMPDSAANRMLEKKLISALNKIISVRCGVPCVIHIDYDTKLKTRTEGGFDTIIEQRIAQISVTADRPGESRSQNTPVTNMEDSQRDSSNQDVNNGSKQNGKEKTGRLNRRELKQSDNPNLIFGREFDGEVTPISDIIGEIGEVIIRGQVVSTETKPIKNEKTIYFFDITDFTDTIHMKIFIHNDYVAEIGERIKTGKFVKVRGFAATDTFSKKNELTVDRISGVMEIKDFREKREDLSVKKRVELHCHTKMSDMDGVSYARDIIKRAIDWGHTAIAITDHGVVQAFPECLHAVEDFKAKDFKILYGTEAYIVDDLSKPYNGERDRSIDGDYVVFDIETTGISPVKNNIIEMGAVKLSGGQIVDRFSCFVDPGEPIPYKITHLTGIKDSDVRNQETIEQVLPKFLDFAAGCVLVAHNSSFDTSFIKEKAARLSLEYDFDNIDTLELSRVLLPYLPDYKLNTVAADLKVSLENHHRALDDALCCGEILLKELDMLREQGIENLPEINELEGDHVKKVGKLHSNHGIILAKNNVGRVNLYRLISESHLTYFAKGRPRIPKSLLNKYREGLILGSACEAGELFEAILQDMPEERIGRIAQYYDYLEIQPTGNDMFLISSDKYPDINSVEDIQDINRKIVALGEKFNKPVVATCDVHFLNPEDEVYRRILMAGKGFSDADDQAPLFFRTTEEMLQEFMYLGPEKAREVVIDNSNAIADMVDFIKPVRPDKCPPVIADSDKTLTDICYKKAIEMYGEPLPKLVKTRLDRELNSIISNGFAVMYIIAQKLVWKSMEDGYLVGSRGSVGSSFVATMSGITEVNPLSPHYYCPECHYADFDSPEVKAFAGMAGVDMPDKECPGCGAMLKKDGFDIPFETFLGFKGDKEPDIDLNFSGEYQRKAHKYTEVIFGKGQTFRAGTISTLADKTAYGFIKKYYEERGKYKRECEINRLVKGCMDVRRSTGQHPGGIVVLPVGEDINSFTPVQHPANDCTTDTITTHFDYHSIDHNLLKLDILGHDDPTMIRKLQDLTGVDPQSIPLDDPKVMSLFQSTEALGIEPKDIADVPLGCLGIPEFGTDFAMGMLIDTKPQHFSDLVRIAGLAHGTDVWLGNAEKLIKEGTATISTAICTRDDIMTYLIQMGVESSRSFKIMEDVRKGKVAKGKSADWEEWKQDMLAHNVPEWYVWSCEHIQYMFPKAHAAAYVMMAWRVAYSKIYYPLEFYTAFFSIRADAFNYETMCFGKERLLQNLQEVSEEIKRKKDNRQKPTSKEEGTVRDMRIVLEMYARGYEFMPIDLSIADAGNFQIIDGKIMPSLISIDGLGEKAAEQIAEGSRGESFLSKEDFRSKTKAGQSITDTLTNLGILENLPESNQLSIFDFVREE